MLRILGYLWMGWAVYQMATSSDLTTGLLCFIIGNLFLVQANQQYVMHVDFSDVIKKQKESKDV